jgi:MFS family permease
VPRFTVTRSVEPATAERLSARRDDVVGEALAGPDGGPEGTRRYVLGDGPFAHYGRTVAVAPPGPDGRVRVEEAYDFALPPGTWRLLLTPAVRLALRRRRPPAGEAEARRVPWWYPPARPDARAARVLGLLATLSLVLGYLGSLLRQTMTFAADEFGAGTAAQGNAFAAVRFGGLLAIALGALADRRGRRLALSLALGASIASTVIGAVAPGLAVLTACQVVNRGSWAAAGILLVIVAAEEMPAGARAYALSLLAMSGALGAGLALWLLPVAGLGERAWRLLFLVPLLFVAPVLRLGRLVPESRRYARPHRDLPLAGHYRRLVLVAGSFLLLNVFAAPQSQFLNEFLRQERGMSATTVSLFGLVTGTPAGIGIVVGGRLADTRGRRLVGAVGIVVGTVLTTLAFVVAGPAMWLCAIGAGIFSAALVPTIAVYGPELFPTSLRGRANGIISTTAMVGSVIGLVAAGYLEDALGSFGRALGVLAVAPLVMAVIVLVWFPETARRELEDLNPEDQLPVELRAGGVEADVLVAAAAAGATAPTPARPARWPRRR